VLGLKLSLVRCDGSAHGGCQLAYLMYRNEASLERDESDGAVEPPELGAEERAYVGKTPESATTNRWT
jgi:hypothetical protein